MIRQSSNRFVALMTALILASGLIGYTMPVTAAPHLLQAKSMNVTVVTDIGLVDDRSFNQSAWEGAQLAAEEFKGKANAIETTNPQDYPNNLSIAAQASDVVVTTGEAIGPAVIDAAQRFPEVYFVAVDSDIEGLFRSMNMTPLPNVIGLVFPSDQAGFLCGLLAARLTKSGIIGAVLPSDQLQPVVAFKRGFENGAKYGRPDIRIFASYNPKGLTEAFTDPQWGAITAGQAIDQGADVVFSGGGTTGNGGLIEVAKRTTPEKPLYCIGVDTDQWETVIEARPCLVTSGLKLIREGVYELLDQYVKGAIKPGNFVGDVGLASFHDFEALVPDAVKEELLQVEKDLQEGTLSTDGIRPGAAPTAEATQIPTQTP